MIFGEINFETHQHYFNVDSDTQGPNFKLLSCITGMQCMHIYIYSIHISYIHIPQTTEYELGVARWLSEWEHKEGILRLDEVIAYPLQVIRMPCQIPTCFPDVTSWRHPFHNIVMVTLPNLWNTIHHLQLTYKTQRLRRCSKSMWYNALSSPSSISGRFVALNPWAQWESLALTESVFPRRRPRGEFLSGRFSLDVWKGTSDTLEIETRG